MAGQELVDNFQDSIVSVVISSHVQGIGTHIQDVLKCLFLSTEGALLGLHLSPQVEVGVMREGVFDCILSKFEHVLWELRDCIDPCCG